MFTNVENCLKNNLSLLVFGESGAGKTSLAKTTPDPKRTLIVNAENGLLSIKGSDISVYDLTKHQDKETKEVKELTRVQRWKKMEHFLDTVATDENVKKKFDWIIIDSLTEISQNLTEALKEKYPDGKDGFKMWGEYNERMVALIKSIRDMDDYNVLFLALDSTDKDENNVRYTGIDVSGKVSSRIPALLDEVFYLKKFTNEEGEQKRTLITSTYKNIIAKDRSGKLGQFVEPNIKKIVEVINAV